MRALALFAAAPFLFAAGELAATPKAPAVGAKQSPPACGAKILPLVTGNTWTYEPVASKDPIRRAPGGAAQSARACGARILPLGTGNTWPYEGVASKHPILPELAKLAPRQAKT